MIRAVLGVLALGMALMLNQAHAQALPNTAIPVWTPSQVGSTYTFSGATTNSANAASISFANAANGAVYGEANQALALGGGRSAGLVIRSTPSALNVAKAVGRFASRFNLALQLGVGLYDLGNELGFNLDNSSGSVVVVKRAITPAGCGSPPANMNYLFSPQVSGGCYGNYAGGAVPVVDSVVNSQGSCNVTYHCSSGDHYGSTASYPVTGVTSPGVPSSIQAFQDAVAAKSVWPSGSAIGRALKDAVASGEPLALPQPSSITGPVSVPGPSSTTTTPAQNGNPATSTTKSTVNNLTYGSNYVINNVVNTTVVNNGTTTTTTTEQTEPDPAPSDTSNPDLPSLYKRQYPDGLTGVWNTRKAELTATPLASLVQAMTPTITGAGGCPQFSIPARVGPLVFGDGTFGPPCYVWDFCKVVVLLSAAFLARALIFGG